MVFKPSIYTNYKFLNYFNTRGSFSYNKSLGDAQKLTQGYVIKNYRNISKGINQLPTSERISLFSALEFKNPVSGWLISSNYRFTAKVSDMIFNQVSLGNGIFQTQANTIDNKSESHSSSNEITYFITNWQSTIGARFDYSHSFSDYLLNSTLNEQENKINSLNLFANFSYWRKLNLKYNIEVTAVDYKTDYNSSSYSEQSHEFSLFYYPDKQHWINIQCEYNISNYNNHIETFFGDLSYTYKPSKGKFKYALKLRNIFDAKKLTQYEYSDIALIKNTYHLRPREILLNISYRF